MKVITAMFKSNTSETVFHPKIGKLLKGTVTEASNPGIKMTLDRDLLMVDYKGVVLAIPVTKFDFLEVEPEANVKKSSK